MDSRLIFLHYCDSVISNGGTQEGRSTGDWKCLAAIQGGSRRQIRGIINSEESGEASLRASQLIDPTLPRKTSSEET